MVEAVFFLPIAVFFLFVALQIYCVKAARRNQLKILTDTELLGTLSTIEVDGTVSIPYLVFSRRFQDFGSVSDETLSRVGVTKEIVLDIERQLAVFMIESSEELLQQMAGKGSCCITQSPMLSLQRGEAKCKDHCNKINQEQRTFHVAFGAEFRPAQFGAMFNQQYHRHYQPYVQSVYLLKFRRNIDGMMGNSSNAFPSAGLPFGSYPGGASASAYTAGGVASVSAGTYSGSIPMGVAAPSTPSVAVAYHDDNAEVPSAVAVEIPELSKARY